MLSPISNIFRSQVQLYEFTAGSKKLYYTSGNKEFLFQNKIYKPATIKSTSIVTTQDKAKANITITTDKDIELGDWFKIITPGDVKVFVWRTSRTNPNQYERVFNGAVLGAEFKQNEIEFLCEPLAGLTSRRICKYTYQTVCNHHVYKGRCGLDVEDHSFFTDIINIENGVKITIAANPYLDEVLGGYLQTTGNNAGLITKVENNIITILAPIEGLSVGDRVRIAKGCDRSSETCKNKFNNFDNFYGFEVVPTRNIFETGIRDTENK